MAHNRPRIDEAGIASRRDLGYWSWSTRQQRCQLVGKRRLHLVACKTCGLDPKEKPFPGTLPTRRNLLPASASPSSGGMASIWDRPPCPGKLRFCFKRTGQTPESCNVLLPTLIFSWMISDRRKVYQDQVLWTLQRQGFPHKSVPGAPELNLRGTFE